MSFRRVVDLRHRFVDGIEELPRGGGGANDIPLERFRYLRSRMPANSKPAHLPQFLGKIGLDLRPRITIVGIRVGVCLAAVQLGTECVGHWRRSRRIETVPETTDKLHALLSGEVVDGNRA
jgi:hypothetical protein